VSVRFKNSESKLSVVVGVVGPELLALLGDLKAQRTYRFLEPWMYTSRSLALAVPIVRTDYGARSYLVLDEVPGALNVRDIGEIRKLMARNQIDKPVFVRGGCILEGSTQPRAVRFGVVVEPQAEQTIEVVCVHETGPIRRGAELRPSLDVPSKLSLALLKGEQRAVWDEVRGYSMSLLMERPTREIRAPMHEVSLRLLTVSNLAEAMRELERAKREIIDVVEKFPNVKDQVGVVIIDTKGVYAIELFDHPDSWDAIAKKAGRKFAEVLAEQQEAPIFKPDKEAVFDAIMIFLDKLRTCQEKEAFRSHNSYTRLIEGDDIVGEYTALKGSVIHLMATRAEEHPPPFFFRRYLPLVTTHLRAPRTMELMVAEEEHKARMSRRVEESLYRVLSVLREGGKTWSEIEEALSGTLSPATISRRLKNGINQGLISKALRENGRVVYELTAKGIALLERLTEKVEEG